MANCWDFVRFTFRNAPLSSRVATHSVAHTLLESRTWQPDADGQTSPPLCSSLKPPPAHWSLSGKHSE
ncbi:hypothetical protein EYF80_054036 [Liparis tanakae]|uniref:Uncharacterized protein n=1 Tax=Liparis tanakae TaxID=230148 RepID=A0A4Z2F4X5_9TELE|nr:hypothetical protein EYF80_054036 [Liparis tanakae]